jgi:mannosyl-3-phosphoglycerate phosphatase
VKVVIFSDLDGTILDENYNFHKVHSTIANLLSLNTALVLCSSKTRTEIEFYRKEMKINDPFISENGGAIFIPKNFFRLQDFTKQTKEYDVIELGTQYHIIRKKIKKIAEKTGSKIVGFGDMSIEEVAKDTGLSIEMAELAKKREYDEPFRLNQNEQGIFDVAKEEGLCVTKGDRYYHLSGQHNKGEAALRLKLLYAENFKQIHTIGVGNGPNDLSLLKVVDSPFGQEEKEHIEKTWIKVLREVKKTTV